MLFLERPHSWITAIFKMFAHCVLPVVWNEIISPCSSRVSCLQVANSKGAPTTHWATHTLTGWMKYHKEVAQNFTNERTKKRPQTHRHKPIMHWRKLWCKTEEQKGGMENELVTRWNKRKDYSQESLLFWLFYSIVPFSLSLPLALSLHGFNGALSQSLQMTILTFWMEKIWG